MKKISCKSALALLIALTLLVSCLLPGLVLPVAAADEFTLAHSQLTMWLGRTRSAGNATIGNTTIPAASITWKSSDTAVATIDNYGTITGLSLGTTTITGSYGDDTQSFLLTVADGSAYLNDAVPHTLGDNLLVNGDFENGNIYWDNATVTAGAGKNSTAGLQLTTANKGYNYKKAIAWKPNTTYQLSFDYLPADNASFYVDMTNMGANAGRVTKTYSATSPAPTEWQTYTKVFTTLPSAYPQTGYTLYICSTTVGSTPVVIDNFELREYTSTQAITGLDINYKALTMQVGAQQTLTVSTLPHGGNLNGMVWASSNPQVAIVENGIVTAVGSGTATVTATTLGGGSISCEVTVKGHAAMLQNAECNSTGSTWIAAGGTNTVYVAGAGKYGSSALRVTRSYPVAQAIHGLRPNTTYTLRAMVQCPNNNAWLSTTVTCGDTVLYSKVDQYYDRYGLYGGTKLPLTVGLTFTTPDELPSGTAVLSFATLKSATDTAPTVGTVSAGSVSTASVEQGEGAVTDNDDDLAIEGKYFVYIDEVVLTESRAADIDLTPTNLTWTGDNGTGQVTPGTGITFAVTVKNQGSDDLPAGTPFTVDIAAGGEVVRTLTCTDGLAAGKEVTVTDTAAWTATAGDHMISARVNAAWDVFETNSTTNQTCQINLRVATDTVAPSYDNVAAAVQQAGMDRLTFSDDFTSLSTIDTTASGAEGYKWYVTRPWGGTTLTTNDYFVKDGVLTLKTAEPTYNISLSTADVKTGNGYSYQNGYLEAKFRIVLPDAGNGAGVPAIWSFTQNKALESINGSCDHWVELDWLEYWGITKQRPGGYYTMTMHDSRTNNATKQYNNSNAHLTGLGNTDWHTMGWLWEQGSIRTFLDGVEVQNNLFSALAPMVPAQTPKKDDNKNPLGSSTDNGAFALADEEPCVLYIGGSLDNPLEIDYIRIWQTSEPAVVSDNMTITADGISESAYGTPQITVSEHDTARLTVTVPAGEDAGTLTWETSNPTVATVHANGLVYARNAGTAVITATNANGQSVLCVVTVTHNLITGGDFEWDNDLLYKNWSYSILSSGYFSVVEDPKDSSNHCLKVSEDLTDKSSSYYYAKFPVQNGKTYRLTGKYKDTLSRFSSTPYFHFYNTTSITDNKKSGTTGTSGWFEPTLSSADANGWKEFSIDFTISDTASLNTYYVWGIGRKEKNVLITYDYDAYYDDLKLVEVEDVEPSAYTLTAGSTANGSLTLAADGKALTSGVTVAAGTTVTVTVNPNSGYRLQAGSLRYSYAKATFDGDAAGANPTVERRILNKAGGYTADNFGQGTGRDFTFVMPAANVSLSAVFESETAADSSAVSTLGSSVYSVVGADNSVAYNGVRFLNRLYVHEDTNLDAGDIYVLHNGAKHKVVEFGSLLKRTDNTAGELTLEGYEAHGTDTGTTRIWRTRAYHGGDVYLVDYTADYLDFTVIMTTKVANRGAFLSRQYTTRAYVKLDDGTVLYSGEAVTDSPLSTLERLHE